VCVCVCVRGVCVVSVWRVCVCVCVGVCVWRRFMQPGHSKIARTPVCHPLAVDFLL
jgi:hypothetical protein